jgi:hypothetical protein
MSPPGPGSSWHCAGERALFAEVEVLFRLRLEPTATVSLLIEGGRRFSFSATLRVPRQCCHHLIAVLTAIPKCSAALVSRRMHQPRPRAGANQ